MNKLISYSLLTLILVTFSLGCGSDFRIDADPLDPSLSLVYGYIDMKEADRPYMNWFHFKRFLPKSEIKNKFRVSKNMFWHFGITNGSHQAVEFGSVHYRTYYTYNLGTGQNETAIRINKPGLYFLGSFKFKRIKTEGLFQNDNFQLERVESPTEKELLELLLKRFQNDKERNFTRQINMINARLKELG